MPPLPSLPQRRVEESEKGEVPWTRHAAARRVTGVTAARAPPPRVGAIAATRVAAARVGGCDLMWCTFNGDHVLLPCE